jgi:hypothetical protein
MSGVAELPTIPPPPEPVRLLDLVEDVNDAIALLDLASSRVEEEDNVT